MRRLKLPGRDPSRPRLDENDVDLIQVLGISEVKQQAEAVIKQKLGDPDSGGNIPLAGNPIYKAMHACNAASREELEFSHRIPADRTLNDKDVDTLVNLLTRWIAREYNFYMQENERQKSLVDFK